MDWYKGATPWNSGHINRGPNRNQNGVWAVTVVKDGTYCFELRHFPREANRAMGLSHARIKLGEVVREKPIAKTAAFATFELDLKAGKYDLQTWLNSVSDKPVDFGALFVYVSVKEKH